MKGPVLKGPVRDGLLPPNSTDIVAEAGGVSTPGLPQRAYYHRARTEVLELVPHSARRLLDVGCGEGTLGASIRARQSAEVHGIELVQNAAVRARHQLDRVWNSSVEQALPTLPEGYYDCIVAADVLEHLIDPWAVLTALRSKLAPGGTIVSSIPNIQNWGVLADLVRGNWEYRDEGILDRTHMRFFTRRSVEELFWTAGLRISSLTTTVRGPAVPPSIIKTLAKAGLATRELEQDGRTFQFLVVAELPPPAANPRVAVVILNWNGKDDTLQCLQAVNQLDYRNYHVVVVDNGSTDGSVAAIKARFPEVVLLETGKNLGYAAGNNVGIRRSLANEAEYVLILNNDTVVDPELLRHLVDAAHVIPEAGVLGPATFYCSARHVIWGIGAKRRSDPMPTYEPVGHGTTADLWPAMVRMDAFIGGAMLVGRDVFRRIGYLDERFFLYWEKYDFCDRANAAGFIGVFVPAANVWQKVEGPDGTGESPVQIYFKTRNHLLWARKNVRLPERVRLYSRSWKILCMIFFPSLAIRKESEHMLKQYAWAFASWYRNVERNISHPKNKALLYGMRDYLLNRFGDCPETILRINNEWRCGSSDSLGKEFDG